MTSPPLHPLKEHWKQLIEAAEADHAKADRLLKAHPELLNHPEFWGQTALHYLVIENRKKGVEFLISRGADVNLGDDSNTETPFHSACMLRLYPMAELLLRSGANANAASLTYDKPLDIALENNDEKLVALLREHGATPTGE